MTWRRVVPALVMAALWAGLVLRLTRPAPRDLRMVGQDTRPVISRRVMGDHQAWLLDAADGWHCAVAYSDWKRAQVGEFWSCAWTR